METVPEVATVAWRSCAIATGMLKAPVAWRLVLLETNEAAERKHTFLSGAEETRIRSSS